MIDLYEQHNVLVSQHRDLQKQAETPLELYGSLLLCRDFWQRQSDELYKELNTLKSVAP